MFAHVIATIGLNLRGGSLKTQFEGTNNSQVV